MRRVPPVLGILQQTLTEGRDFALATDEAPLTASTELMSWCFNR